MEILSEPRRCQTRVVAASPQTQLHQRRHEEPPPAFSHWERTPVLEILEMFPVLPHVPVSLIQDQCDLKRTGGAALAVTDSGSVCVLACHRFAAVVGLTCDVIYQRMFTKAQSWKWAAERWRAAVLYLLDFLIQHPEEFLLTLWRVDAPESTAAVQRAGAVHTFYFFPKIVFYIFLMDSCFFFYFN